MVYNWIILCMYNKLDHALRFVFFCTQQKLQNAYIAHNNDNIYVFYHLII